ncbi:MAG: alpha-N-acetylglucosaminidase [Reichenbachiella sp.]|uniref:alpha-N-acetylglucosaminidase n=1 Tax=Reichenbachiella sp. TaxID=2184521 RepID=UPI002966BD30|nr:alpha-N-acetylglucosaminidase [Reichenbachiella sp.]MDW3211467.1 alpha-N-acetylglucosaminidase [Reichenbachiella sp.]
MKSQIIIFLIVTIFISSCDEPSSENNSNTPSEVLGRLMGQQSEIFDFELVQDDKKEWFKLSIEKERVKVQANSQIALCRGGYDYLKNECKALISWSGNNINIPEKLPAVNRKVETPYQFRYYFNVVTHGYTTAYWDWNRWEKEIDWMAVHGLDMPLIGGAHEAILARVFKKLGLSQGDIDDYFSGPAHFPWNRMGNLNGWDGPLPDSYFDKQIELTHQILDRMYALGMTPIIHAFAGFVPRGIKELYPNVEVRELGWGGGLPLENNAFILAPDSPLFVEIGRKYIEEWEKEFGKASYYLADSFNEMDVPEADNPAQQLEELAGFGKSVYESIKSANSDATWVMQGWTFPYHKDENGELFWTPERLQALVSEVPDDKLLILDMANEYNHDFWKIDPSWKMYDGFFGKKWIYSFIPNMGGKVPLNGILDTYATIPEQALQYHDRKNQVGFGFAPEGIENNEIIYELLSDMGWRETKIDLDRWIENYSTQRYGDYPEQLKLAFQQLRESCYGTFTDHPMHRYQFRPYSKPEGVEDHATVHQSDKFMLAVNTFLSCSDELKDNELFVYDAIEIVVQGLGLIADQKLLNVIDVYENGREADLDEVMEILLVIDRLLASHPNHNLQRWVDFARSWGEISSEKQYYESNAKRLITTWGGDPVNDYSGRVWSGLIRDYYVPRWINYYKDPNGNKKQEMRDWEENWIKTPGVSSINPYENPLKIAKETFAKYYQVRH